MRKDCYRGRTIDAPVASPTMNSRGIARNVPTGWVVSGYSLHGIYEFVLADAQQIGMLLRGSGVAM